jgi:hypothetical protein
LYRPRPRDDAYLRIAPMPPISMAVILFVVTTVSRSAPTENTNRIQRSRALTPFIE